MWKVVLFCATALLSLANTGAALSQILTPIVGGMPVYCTDATGQAVYTAWVPNLNDGARSTILPNGMRLIELNTSAFAYMPPLLQMFVYAHECGHHISGDIVAGFYLHEVNFNMEKNADRIGIRILRDQFGLTLAQATALANVFYNNPPMSILYLPGPMRAQWILNCYKTNDDACTTP